MRNQAKEVRILPQFLYIEPTSVCNLHCTMCYTNVINGPARRVLESEQILGFVRRFVASTPSPISLYWCGTGEVGNEVPENIERSASSASGIRVTIAVAALSVCDAKLMFHAWDMCLGSPVLIRALQAAACECRSTTRSNADAV